MGAIRVLTEAELRAAVGLGEEEMATIEAVYPLISAGVGSMPPILRIDVPEHRGEVDVKSAYLPGFDGIAVKVSAGFFDNPAAGLPSLGGLMIVLDSRTGLPVAALFDNGYLTDLRTALAGAVAAEHLAVEGAATAAVLGAGTQAGLQIEALCRVRPIRRVAVWSRRSEQASALARRLAAGAGLDVETAASPAEAIAGAQVVVTTTPSAQPLVEASMLHPGLHVTAVGSDTEHKQELGAGVAWAADRFVCDSIGQSVRLGELRAAVEAGYSRTDAVELGDVVARRSPGRRTDTEVTVCDLTGTGAQDTAIAGLAVRRCTAAGTGTLIDV